MPKILLQEEIPFKLLDAITAEFPQYTFIDKCESSYDWHGVEIIYGDSLKVEQLIHAPRLKWIHNPSVETDKLCMEQIKERSDILLSLGTRFNASQIAEYVMGVTLAYGKQFFKWQQAPSDPVEFAQWPLMETMWTLRDRTMLQIGLGWVGTEIVRYAQFFGMQTWGIRTRRSFHPYCRKTFSLKELHSLLPNVDVVSVSIPRRRLNEVMFGEAEFRLMKKDSLFIVTGSAEPIDQHALAKVAAEKKFRGIVFDTFHPSPLPRSSPLRSIPDALLTPGVSGVPQLADAPSIKLFLRNLRIYLTGKYQEMKNLVGT